MKFYRSTVDNVYLGARDDTLPPFADSAEVPFPPQYGGAVWNGSGWDEPPAPPAARFESEEFPIVLGGEYQMPHSLGQVPSVVQLFLVCKETDLGYPAGFTVPLDNVQGSPNVDLSALTMGADATNITLVVNDRLSFCLLNRNNINKTAAKIARSKWRMKVVAERKVA